MLLQCALFSSHYKHAGPAVEHLSNLLFNGPRRLLEFKHFHMSPWHIQGPASKHFGRAIASTVRHFIWYCLMSWLVWWAAGLESAHLDKLTETWQRYFLPITPPFESICGSGHVLSLPRCCSCIQSHDAFPDPAVPMLPSICYESRNDFLETINMHVKRLDWNQHVTT